MSKAVLISIRPKWCELIASGKKTIEVRKTKPKLSTPFKCYIYCPMASYKGKYLHTSNKHGQLLFWDNPKDTSITVQPENYDYMAYTCRGKVIGEFVCDEIIEWSEDMLPPVPLSTICLYYSQIRKYGGDKILYLWHISDLKIYDNPKELSEFYKDDFEEALSNWEDLFSIGVPTGCAVEYSPEPKEEDYILTRPPQSWCYVERLDGEQ